MLLTMAALSARPTLGADAQQVLDHAMGKAAALTGLSRTELGPNLQDFTASATRDRQLPLYRALMAQPLRAPVRVARLEAEFRKAAASPKQLVAHAIGLAGARMSSDGARAASAAADGLLRCARDPLAVGMRLLHASLSHESETGELPSAEDAWQTWPLRLQVGRMLAAIGHAHRLRTQALARLPNDATPERLLRQLRGADRADGADYRGLLSLVDRQALFDGMQHLSPAVQTLNDYLAREPRLPSVAWQWKTPLGFVVIDTTGRNSERHLEDPLLIVDVGGNDTYMFEARSEANRISVLLDRGGDDRYVAQQAAADPSAAVLGYGILWDTAGNDRYEGGDFAQAAALFGAAMHVDNAGDDVYQASGFSQGFALGGVAVLLSGAGNDRFSALTHAQAAAGPEGVTVLIDTSGNEHYTLGNTPLAMPSSQLPDRNVSMGQGAGRGERAIAGGSAAATGGIGLLLDLQGDDHYAAQVFAQGVGYYEGVGLLIDGGGSDTFEAAWYAMGASAHQAVGILVKHGTGSDTYRATHSTSLGAAHDFSVAFFVDEGGDDTYLLGNLGLGAAHDNSVAVFLEMAGDDRYRVDGQPCHAFGIAKLGDADPARRHLPALGIFREASGIDRYPSHCGGPRDNAAWTSPTTFGKQKPRSESGAGMDDNNVRNPR